MGIPSELNMYRFSIPPSGYVRYEYKSSTATTPESSPTRDHAYPTYFIPQPKTQTASPTSRRTRHPRHESYSSPQGPAVWHSVPGYTSQEYYANLPEYHYASPRGGETYVSLHGKSRRYPSSGSSGNGYPSKRHASVKSQTQRIFIDTSDEAEDDTPMYTYIRPRSKPHKEKYAKADTHFFYDQEPAYDDTSDSEIQRSRARRSSQSHKPKVTTSSRPAKPPPPPPVATAADALRAGIPAGYSIKNWDPTESPIILLGSVFDANSLGKWIYDWTIYRHGPATPIAEVAGDLWLLLIKLAGKMKRADECLPRIKSSHNEELVGSFLDSGDRLWGRLSGLLKACEEYMWKAARKGGKKGSIDMGRHTGTVFVDSMFGRDRELDRTESLMQSIRLWDVRFDANCEDILRNPSARRRRTTGT